MITNLFNYKYSYLITLSMGIAALFIGWFLFPPSSLSSLPSEKDTYEISGRLKKITRNDAERFTFLVESPVVGGVKYPNDVEVSTPFPAELIADLSLNQEIHFLNPKYSGLALAYGKPYSWQVSTNKIIMSKEKSLVYRLKDIENMRNRAINIVIFGFFMILVGVVSYFYMPVKSPDENVVR